MQEKHWTTDDIPDLSGKVIIVTGANSGIGYEAAKAFAHYSAQTILACRSEEEGPAAALKIRSTHPDAHVDCMHLDLTSLASVSQFAEAFKDEYNRLDVLVNNAGIMMVPYARTEDDFELHFGTNHLGHFALTGLLLEQLLTTPGARVVTISSTMHRIGRMDFENLMYDGGNGYTPSSAYGRSKLANLLFTYALQRRFEAVRSKAIAVAAHPGGTNTNLQDEIYEHWYIRVFKPFMQIYMQDAHMGALPTMRAAVDPDVKGGQYYGPGGWMEQRGYPVLVESSAASHNLEDANRLWQISEELTGVSYEKIFSKFTR